MPNVLISGSHNLLQTSGPVQACNGIALPFTITVNSSAIIVWPENNFGKNATNCGGQPDDTVVAGNFKYIEELKTNLMSLVIFISLIIFSTCFGH